LVRGVEPPTFAPARIIGVYDVITASAKFGERDDLPVRDLPVTKILDIGTTLQRVSGNGVALCTRLLCQMSLSETRRRRHRLDLSNTGMTPLEQRNAGPGTPGAQLVTSGV